MAKRAISAVPDAPPPRRTLRTQKFYLDDGVEVAIRFEPGKVRWTSTQSSVSIATGTSAPQSMPAMAGAQSPQPESWSNCDNRGLGFVQGTADPKEVLKNGLPAVAAGVPLQNDTLDFLSKVDDSVAASEGVTNEELEGELLSGEVADA